MRILIFTCIPLLLVLLVLLQTVSSKPRQGSGVILVKISSILNPEGRDAAGSCCSAEPSSGGGVCPGPCYSMLRVCASNVKNESVLVIHGGKPNRKYGEDGKRQPEDIENVRKQEVGIRGRNPQADSVEYSTRRNEYSTRKNEYSTRKSEYSIRKSGSSGNLRPKLKTNPSIQFSEQPRIPPKLSLPKDFKSPIRIAPNKLPPNTNIGRRPYINPQIAKNRPKNRNGRPPTKLYTNFAIPPSLDTSKNYQFNPREPPAKSRPYREKQPLPQSRNGLPYFDRERGRENHVWETNEYTVMWREERMLLEPSTECKFGSLTTDVIFNNSLENQGDLLVRLPFYEGWSGVFELTIEAWHIKNPKKIPQPVKPQSKKVEEKSIFASFLEKITTSLTKTVNDIELKKSKSENKNKEEEKTQIEKESNVTTVEPEENNTDNPNEGVETTTASTTNTTLKTKEKIGKEAIEIHKDKEDTTKIEVKKDINKPDKNKEDKTDNKDDTDEESGHWQVMTNKAKLILRLERDHMIYAGEDWQSSYFTSYHSRIDYSIKLSCAKNYTGPACSFAKICLSKNIKFHKRLTCTEDGQILCRPGWAGAVCDQPICAPGCDPANGYCKTPGECRCKTGYFGDNCESCIKLLGCSSHGSCNRSYECICEEDYTGVFCTQPRCKEGCSPTYGFCSQPGQCKCKTGWQGENCTECVKKPGCINGTCSKPYECNCEEGFKGKFCDKPDCGNGCHETNGYCSKPGECFCKIGFQGERCDKCLPYPGCLNGMCERPWDCKCLDGWMGLKCNQIETEIFGDDLRDGRCLPVGVFRCMNGGIDICTWTGNGTMVDQPRCQCKNGFSGKYCQDSLGESDGVYRALGVVSDDVSFQFPSKLDNSLEKLK
eukprot:GFUD01007240.1.p1 GENE.GFUD01007240.1~~GFUD01007240.1.p1  ORF type:complete len:882 (+),score=165.63 GFUD01007240.1:158-2803(+)